MLRRAVEAHAGCDGILLGSHGLFTWGDTQQECYARSIKTIDQMGDFVDAHGRRSGRPLFGGARTNDTEDRESTAAAVLPFLRGAVSSTRRVIAHYDRSEEALGFANSQWAPDCASWARAVRPLSQDADLSDVSSRGIPAARTSRVSGSASPSGWSAIARTTSRTTRRARSPTHLACATRIHRSW